MPQGLGLNAMGQAPQPVVSLDPYSPEAQAAALAIMLRPRQVAQPQPRLPLFIQPGSDQDPLDAAVRAAARTLNAPSAFLGGYLQKAGVTGGITPDSMARGAVHGLKAAAMAPFTPLDEQVGPGRAMAEAGVPLSEGMQLAADIFMDPTLGDPTDLLKAGILAGPKLAAKVGDKVKGVAKSVAAAMGKEFPTTSAARIVAETNGPAKGYSVHMATGKQPQSGRMVSSYANTHPRAFSTEPGVALTEADVVAFVNKNKDRLSKPDQHLGTWVNEADGKTYLDVSAKFDPKTPNKVTKRTLQAADENALRAATKFGERTRQIAGFDLTKANAPADLLGQTDPSFPIGHWEDFIRGKGEYKDEGEFLARMNEMQKVGDEYIKSEGGKEWWTLSGSNLAKVYGEDKVKQLAGFLAATAPNASTEQNLRTASEYMRRFIKGEDVLQPGFRIPETADYYQPGAKMQMEGGRKRNLKEAAAGNLDALGADKVREEAKALMGDDSATVFDRYWAKVSEDPLRGLFASVKKDIMPPGKPYAALKSVVTDAAKAAGMTPRNYSAQVWTGIRETIKAKGKLFGTPMRTTASNASVGYSDLFPKILADKAKKLKISVAELESRLRHGDAELLGVVLATPIGWAVYQQSQGNDPPEFERAAPKRGQPGGN